jgi:glycosyltransferase involved in cell wall biosynthesis
MESMRAGCECGVAECVVVCDHDPGKFTLYPPWVTRVQGPARGNLGATLNKGLAYCNGEWVVRLDSDDWSVFNRLAIHDGVIHGAPPGLAAVGGAIWHVSGLEVPVRSGPVAPTGDWGSLDSGSVPLWHPACAIRRDVLQHLGGWPEEPGIEDFCLWWLMRSTGWWLGAQPDVVTYHRVSPKHPGEQARRKAAREAYVLSHPLAHLAPPPSPAGIVDGDGGAVPA